MNELLKTPYYRFYTPYENEQTELACELKRYDGHLRGDKAEEDVRRSILCEEEE